jgi:hypothetical protein
MSAILYKDQIGAIKDNIIFDISNLLNDLGKDFNSENGFTEFKTLIGDDIVEAVTVDGLAVINPGLDENYTLPIDDMDIDDLIEILEQLEASTKN